MPRPFSAYAALELEPGADRAAVEAAYRRLIKLHHPDRSGGDARRAAEINRAYFELRSLPVPVHPPTPRSSGRRQRRRRRDRQTAGWFLLLVAALVPVALMQGDILRQVRQWASEPVRAIGAPSPRPTATANEAFDDPVDQAVVAASVGDAVRLVRAGDQTELVSRSRDCHRRMRAEPNLARLDRCAAFDTAVAALEDRDPDRDTGPFNASSVTARQMTAASLLSNDYLAIERRLNRVRSEVELALMPPAPAPTVVVRESEATAVEQVP